MLFIAVSDNTRPVMSKTSSDFGFFLRRYSKSEGSRLSSEPLRKQKFQKFTQRVQKVMVCDLWLVDFDPFCVCSLLLNFRVRVLCALSVARIWALMFCCVIKTFHFLAPKVFFFITKHGKFRFPRWNCSYRASKSRRYTNMGGWKSISTFSSTFNLKNAIVFCDMYLQCPVSQRARDFCDNVFLVIE